MLPLPSFADLFERADSRPQPVDIAVAGGDDPTVIEALESLCERGWVRPLLIGPETGIRTTARSLNYRLMECSSVMPRVSHWHASRSMSSAQGVPGS